jgi:hypothetical protein
LNGQDSGQGDALFFATAEVVGGSVEAGGDSHLLQCGPGSGFGFRTGEARLEGAEGDVIEDGGKEELVVGVLEEEADFAAKSGEVGGGDGEVADVEFAFASEDSIEVEEEGGFAGAVGAEDGDAFGLVEMEVDSAEGPEAVVVGEREVAGADDAAHWAPPEPRASMARWMRSARA